MTIKKKSLNLEEKYMRTKMSIKNKIKLIEELYKNPEDNYYIIANAIVNVYEENSECCFFWINDEISMEILQHVLEICNSKAINVNINYRNYTIYRNYVIY